LLFKLTINFETFKIMLILKFVTDFISRQSNTNWKKAGKIIFCMICYN